MNKFEFTLKFALPKSDERPEAYLDALFENGCDDALAGTGKLGRIALDFSRDASSAEGAVLSAMQNVRSAIPGATLIEASPDLVGASDIAETLGITRQAVQKVVATNTSFPDPFHTGKYSIWHLATVLEWYSTNVKREIDGPLAELASFNRELNTAKESQKTSPQVQEQIQAAIA